MQITVHLLKLKKQNKPEKQPPTTHERHGKIKVKHIVQDTPNLVKRDLNFVYGSCLIQRVLYNGSDVILGNVMTTTRREFLINGL